MKTPQPLENAVWTCVETIGEHFEYDEGQLCIDEPEKRKEKVFSFRDVKSACEFYLRYMNYPEVFLAEHPEYKNQKLSNVYIRGKPYTIEYIAEREKRMMTDDKFYDPDFALYNRWLFKLAFKDVFKEEK